MKQIFTLVEFWQTAASSLRFRYIKNSMGERHEFVTYQDAENYIRENSENLKYKNIQIFKVYI